MAQVLIVSHSGTHEVVFMSAANDLVNRNIIINSNQNLYYLRIVIAAQFTVGYKMFIVGNWYLTDICTLSFDDFRFHRLILNDSLLEKVVHRKISFCILKTNVTVVIDN